MLNRLKEAQENIKNHNLDCFFFSSHSNVFYLSGFSSSNAYIVLTPEKGYFLTDGRYYEGAKEKVTHLEVILIKKLSETLRQIFQDLNIKKVGFEKDKVSVSFYEKLKSDFQEIQFEGFDGFLNNIRMVKSEEEIEIIKDAVIKTDKIFSKILENINSFDTELSVRRKIVDLIFEEGGTSESFPAIVATGKHSAIPHHETSLTKIEKNSPLLIDMGMKLKGYCSDFTRTIFIGKPNQKLIDIYNIVKEAHLEAVSVVKTGIQIKEIDIKARSVIEKYGYGEYFIHSTGHGIGIDIHEEPRIYKDNEDILKENTVFTIEPGIYIPDLGGVRLENIVVARKNSAELLTQTPLDLIII
ncbi:MAG: Xaa-Pro peptidase family protein [Hydrogenothermaceae bacterium]|nr:Xaa-Pro peptidase family protein [Hydrogenothermaceae bacterium]